ncbi:MAG: HAD hydrolase-like protein, partial [Actinomycetota bacterium]|nr:HAD hydrolase-like protein [Actinomycetota bacterium]
RELAEAGLAIRAGALWVACNVDRTLPTERGLMPGNGALVAAVRAATDEEPIVAGKPASPLMIQSIADADRPLVVGDRLDTDIEGAVAVNAASLFVLTGVSTPRDLIEVGPRARPTYLAADIRALTESAHALEIAQKPGWEVEFTADGIKVAGHGEPLDLLRTLCAIRWAEGEGAIRVHPTDETSTDALSALGLTEPRGRHPWTPIG